MQAHGGVGLAGLRHAKTGAGDALVMVQALALHIGQGGMGKQQLPGSEGRAQFLRAVHAQERKSHLKTQ